MKPRVLITREPERARELSDMLESQGITTLIQPATLTVYCWQNREIPDLTRFHWLAFTSVNGVIAFADALMATETEIPQEVSLAAVGPATARELETRLRKPQVILGKPSGKGLAEALAMLGPSIQGTDLLWPCSMQADNHFLDVLISAGVRARRWDCYATRAMPPEMLSPRLEQMEPWDVVVFAAPSAVKAFLGVRPLPWNFQTVSIGSTTAEALSKAGVQPSGISLNADAVSIAKAVLKVLKDRSLSSDEGILQA